MTAVVHLKSGAIFTIKNYEIRDRIIEGEYENKYIFIPFESLDYLTREK